MAEGQALVVEKGYYTYDAEADALYVLLGADPDPTVAKTVELGPELHVDLDRMGQVVGVEILYPRLQMPDLSPLKKKFGIDLRLPFTFAA